MITKFNLFESNFSTIRNYKPDTRNLGDNEGAELKKTFKMIYELEYKLHMMSVLRYIGTQKRKKILTETYEARLSDLLTTSLIMFRKIFGGWSFKHVRIDHIDYIKNKLKEVDALIDQLPEKRKEYYNLTLDKKMILFHKCLNQTHVNGSMLDYFRETFRLKFDFEEFLDDLSNDTTLQDLWKDELDSMNFIELKGNASANIPKKSIKTAYV